MVHLSIFPHCFGAARRRRRKYSVDRRSRKKARVLVRLAIESMAREEFG